MQGAQVQSLVRELSSCMPHGVAEEKQDKFNLIPNFEDLPQSLIYMGLILGLGRSPGEGNGNALQHSCLGNSMDRGAWWATVHETAKELDVTEQLHREGAGPTGQSLASGPYGQRSLEWALSSLVSILNTSLTFESASRRSGSGAVMRM